jgi:hypothetical protein
VAGSPDTSLLTLLSQAFVAYTIEADHAFESRAPHRISLDHGDPATSGPLLTSLAFWSNYLRHIPDRGVTVGELAALSGDGASTMKSNLAGLARWSYLTIASTKGTPPGENVITLTPDGTRARDTWAPIDAEIEERWRSRFGTHEIDALRHGLTELAGDGGSRLPLGFPTLNWDRATDRVHQTAPDAAVPVSTASGLSPLFVRALLTLALDFDSGSSLSLPISAILLPELEHPIALRDLPRATGVSKEVIASAIGGLRRAGLVGADPKLISLTADGTGIAAAARDEVAALEARHQVPGLSAALAGIGGPQLALGLTPPKDGWRTRKQYAAQTAAMLDDPQGTLPRYPMVSHRAGWPDGS